MITSPLKKITHSRSSSRTSNNLRINSSDSRRNGSGQGPSHHFGHSSHQQQQQQQQQGHPGYHPQKQQPQQQSRITSMDLARQYEADRAKITKCCFNRREPDGQLHESYITHVRIIEDSHHPSARPPLDSPSSHKKQRFLMLGVKKTGRVRLHKGRENNDGTVQIGRTWDLDELTKLEKDLLVPTGFMLVLGKPYYWETNTPKEATVFNTSVISTYIKYTSKLPELVNWDLKALGISPPPSASRSATNSSQEKAPQQLLRAPSESFNDPRAQPRRAATSDSFKNQRVEQRMPPQRAATSESFRDQKLQRAPTSESLPPQPLNLPKIRQAISTPAPAPISTPAPAPAPAKQEIRRTAPESREPLQIQPPNQSTFAPKKNLVLGAGASSLPNRIQLQQEQEQQPRSQLQYQSNTQSKPQYIPQVETPPQMSVEGLIKVPTKTSSKSSVSDSLGAQLSHQITAGSQLKSTTSSIQGISFNKNRASYVDVERETEEGASHLSIDDDGEDDDDYDDDEDDDNAGFDISNYYTSLSPEPESEKEPVVTRDTKELNNKSENGSQDFFNSKSPTLALQSGEAASMFADELIKNIQWSPSDDVTTLEKKLTRQLVISGNEKCQLLIDVGDGNVGLKSSLDSCLAECEKLAPLMAFYKVELLSYKDEINQLDAKADITGFVNRKLLYSELASSLK